MRNNEITEWTAGAVAQAILNSGKSKNQVATETAIPYRTLDRKLRQGTDFTLPELWKIAEVVGVSPSAFTPPIFQKPERLAA